MSRFFFFAKWLKIRYLKEKNKFQIHLQIIIQSLRRGGFGDFHQFILLFCLFLHQKRSQLVRSFHRPDVVAWRYCTSFGLIIVIISLADRRLLISISCWYCFISVQCSCCRCIIRICWSCRLRIICFIVWIHWGCNSTESLSSNKRMPFTPLAFGFQKLCKRWTERTTLWKFHYRWRRWSRRLWRNGNSWLCVCLWLNSCLWWKSWSLRSIKGPRMWSWWRTGQVWIYWLYWNTYTVGVLLLGCLFKLKDRFLPKLNRTAFDNSTGDFSCWNWPSGSFFFFFQSFHRFRKEILWSITKVLSTFSSNDTNSEFWWCGVEKVSVNSNVSSNQSERLLIFKNNNFEFATHSFFFFTFCIPVPNLIVLALVPEYCLE